ncbi:MAG: hypothetical protein Q8M77_03740 [Hydrogenophaga sp.]|nr:hypothetical protein [Hydrogenophaga sp.]
MDIPPNIHAWQKAEAELADIERAFRAMSADLSATDRERVTQQLAALRAARLRVRLLFEEIMSESAWIVERLAATDRLRIVQSTPPPQPDPDRRVS